jgi:predicted GTPase
MNDKIKELLENAEQSDAIAINKWRIENREYLRKERKEKLKELMEKDKQQTAVEWLLNAIETKNGEEFSSYYTEFIEQAKEMEKKQIIEAFDFGDYCVDLPEGGWKQKYDSPEQYYNETYGGGKQ